MSGVVLSHAQSPESGPTSFRHRCPDCGGGQVHRAITPGVVGAFVEWAMRWVARRRLYRCDECLTCFWDVPTRLSLSRRRA